MKAIPTAGQARQRYIDLETASAEVSSRKKNLAKLATSFHVAGFQGGNGYANAGTITFDLAFLDEPIFASGIMMIRPPDLGQWRMPQVSVYINRWQMDARQMYIGADLGIDSLIVPNPNVEPTAAPVTQFAVHLSFTGTAVPGGL